MKIISGFFKFIGFLILVFVILSLPFSLVLRGTGNIVFSLDQVMDLIAQNLLDVEILAGMAEQSLELISFGDQGNIFNDVVETAIRSLDFEEWVEVFRLAAPPEFAARTIRQVLSGFYEWLDNDEVAPEFSLDLGLWKENLVANSIPLTETILNAIPQCTPAQLDEYQSLEFLVGEPPPICRPPEPIYSMILDQVSVLAPAQMGKTLDEIKITGLQNLNQDQLILAKQALRRTRFVMRWSWVGILALFLIAVLMGTRSWQSLFSWSGWPLLLSGLLTLALALTMVFFSEGVLAFLGNYLLSEVPIPLLLPVQGIIQSVLNILARTMLIQAAALIALGGGALVLAYLLFRRHGGGTEDFMESSGDPVSPEGEETLMVDNSEVEEGERPKGIFG